MIDLTEFRAILEKYLQDNFSTLPIRFENTFFDSTDIPHIVLEDNPILDRSLDMNKKEWVVEGILIIDIHTKIGSGTELAKSVASELVDLLNNSTLKANFISFALTTLGASDLDPLYTHRLEISYQYIYGQDDKNDC